MSDGKEVANQSAMQVQNLKQNLNEWKYVITAADAVLNTADPMKSAAAHAGLYTSVYVLFLITNVSSIPTQNPIFTPYPTSPHTILPLTRFYSLSDFTLPDFYPSLDFTIQFLPLTRFHHYTILPLNQFPPTRFHPSRFLPPTPFSL